MKKILVTGAAGFIGYHLVKNLLSNGETVIGLDSLNDYYDPHLKYGRLSESGIQKENIVYNALVNSSKHTKYYFIKLKLEDHEGLNNLFKTQCFTHVINLAAQAGVRYSIENPKAYIDSNIVGFLNVLEACRQFSITHLTYASSSSVYGLNEQVPFQVQHNVDHPISLYAASKKSNELMAHTYSHLFNLPTTGLRFFTVYGPWGRPDMAYYLFTDAILNDKAIKVFNDGLMSRDFTYIDDIVHGIVRVNDNAPLGNESWTGMAPSPDNSKAPYRIYNIGNSSPVKLMDFIETIETHLGKKAKKDFMPMQPGDVVSTYADTKELVNDFDYKPNTPLTDGIREFVNWYKKFNNI
ncbi:NAD-dependent epimerase [Roseivirga misakiensis]|uniref:Capsule biosynthesis protein CapI n=1 Tax=Roseivirga misakiensis TaxID=1563681 RepID=A0A1E5T603_9BACT|nr:NAD-dependent epimerase [Roseivirga misakiensis]OEK06790.1 capsule biosynthesis protein CapI [Roseivirga misakiensis]